MRVLGEAASSYTCVVLQGNCRGDRTVAQLVHTAIPRRVSLEEATGVEPVMEVLQC